MTILERLFELQDTGYGDFQAKLTPGIDRENFIGVRNPLCRNLAKELVNSKDKETQTQLNNFLNTLPHKYYDENMLHGMIICCIKDFDQALELTEKFLPYIDNWAVCDSTTPKVFKKNKTKLIDCIKKWSSSKEVYTCRFGIKTLMTFFLDDDFKPEYLEIPAKVISDEYYVNMMIAWYFATALAKQWDSTIPYIQNKKLGDWVHRKTIQKARESFRITPEQKDLLNKLK